MDLKSIIDTIRNAIATEMSANVELVDRSLLADKLTDRSEPAPSESTVKALDVRPLWLYDPSKRLSVTYAVLRFLWHIFLALLCVVYGVVSLLAWAVTGRKHSRVTSIRLNTVFFVAVVISYVTILVMMVAFFMFNVLFYTNENNVNIRGAVTVSRSCNREHAIYLLSSSSFWANTGIQVVEGDEIEVTSSGAFHGDIGQLDSCARQNRKPKYAFNRGLEEREHLGNDSLLCPDAPFGALLCDIRFSSETEYRKDSAKDSSKGRCIIVPPGKHPFKAPKGGELFFCVNDIYPAKNKDLKEYWYGDNVGELLLNISITRSKVDNPGIIDTSLFARIYRWLETSAYEGTLWKKIGMAAGIVILWLFADWFISRRIRKYKEKHQ